MTTISRRQALIGAGALTAAAALPGAFPGAFADAVREPRNWRLGFATPPASLDSELRRIEGRLPVDLEGTLYRVGPAQFERDGERLGHWFDGDGMVQRFAIGDGRIRHRGRFVDTEKRKHETEAGRFLYPGYGFSPRARGEARRPDDLNAANTSVLAVGGELWALWEGGSPWRLDRDTLDTHGRKSFGGDVDGAPFSAHPKRGPDGDVWNFGVLGAQCIIWNIAPDGSLRRHHILRLPQPSLMHDFAVTTKHVVLVAPPLLATGGPGDSLVDRYAWRADKPLQVIVLDKDDLTRQRIYELPAAYLFHIGNAWEDEAGAIRLDAYFDRDSSFASQGARDLVQGRYTGAASARLTMLTLHRDGRAESREAPGVAGEFPQIDHRRVGARHRYTYGIIENGVGRFDWDAGRHDVFSYGAATWAEEPLFVPRKGRSGEDDGWVIATALHHGARRTEVVVFDARRIGDGPVARYACGYPLPLGFHGAFVA